MVDERRITGRPYIANTRRMIQPGATVEFLWEFPVTEPILISSVVGIQNGGVNTDITFSSLTVRRADGRNREEVIFDGSPTLPELAGPNFGQAGLLPALEQIAIESKIEADVTNNNGNTTILASISFWGYTISQDELERIIGEEQGAES